MKINGLNHITLSVSDLNISFDFYKETLGFSPQLKWDKGAYFLAGNIWFVLSEEKVTRKKALPEYTHIAFDVSDSNFNQVTRRIENSGAEIFKENKSEGKSLYFLDPDGHKLEIHCGDLQSRLKYYKQHKPNDYTFFN